MGLFSCAVREVGRRLPTNLRWVETMVRLLRSHPPHSNDGSIDLLKQKRRHWNYQRRLSDSSSMDRLLRRFKHVDDLLFVVLLFFDLNSNVDDLTAGLVDAARPFHPLNI